MVWEVRGHGRVQGREAFDSWIEDDAFEGSPGLEVQRVVVAGDTVVVPHRGRIRRRDGGTFTFDAVDLLDFRGGLIERVEPFVVHAAR